MGQKLSQMELEAAQAAYHSDTDSDDDDADGATQPRPSKRVKRVGGPVEEQSWDRHDPPLDLVSVTSDRAPPAPPGAGAHWHHEPAQPGAPLLLTELNDGPEGPSQPVTLLLAHPSSPKMASRASST